MKLTPPTNTTFFLSAFLGVVALGFGFFNGFSVSTYVLLAGLALLIVGNVYEKI